MKHILDIALTGTTQLAAASALLAVAVAVKVNSTGPAFFVQSRMGRGCRPIRILAPCTMVGDMDGRGAVAHDLGVIVRTALAVVPPAREDPVLGEAEPRIVELNRETA